MPKDPKKIVDLVFDVIHLRPAPCLTRASWARVEKSDSRRVLLTSDGRDSGLLRSGDEGALN